MISDIITKFTIDIPCREGNWWFVIYLIEPTIIWVVLTRLPHLIVGITKSSALHIIHESTVLVIISVASWLIIESLITIEILPWTVVLVLHHGGFTAWLRERESVSQKIVALDDDINLTVYERITIDLFWSHVLISLSLSLRM